MVLSHRRTGILLLGFLLVLSLAALRALQLGTLNSGRLSADGALEWSQAGSVIAPRGAIVDRNGTVLALTTPADDVSATPYQVHHPYRAALALGPYLHIPLQRIVDLIAHPTSVGFVYLARQVPDAAARAIAKLNLPGISVTPDPARIYPFEDLAAQVLGGFTGTAAGGIEDQFNSVLAGTNGWRRTVFANGGQAISVTDTRVARPGKTVQLTLDAAVQQAAEHALAGVGATYHPLDASALVTDPRTGAVLAMANWPRANANDPRSTFAFANHAITLNYEPGSTFKVVTIAAALSLGLVTPNTTFTVPGSIQIADRVIHDAEAHATETLTVSQILARSSNVGAIEIAHLLGTTNLSRANTFASWVTRFGFGSLTGINLPGEEEGIVNPVSAYSGSSMGNLPIGQGESVTPIQIATAYAAIANGGILRPPHIVSRLGGVLQSVPRAHRILTPVVAAELRTMLEGVTAAGGTASEVSIPGYVLAGKTGTANKAVNGVYSTTQYYASFVGFAPAEHPRVEVTVIVDDPKGGEFGTVVAAPAWQKIMSFALPYLKIPPG